MPNFTDAGALSNSGRAPFEIGSCAIGGANAPFIVAEMSGNHNQSLDRAILIVEAAAKAGANAVKLQTYTAETMTIDVADREFLISDAQSLWSGRTLHDLYREAYTPWEWHAPIMRRCAELGLVCFSSPFDSSAVEFLETLNVPCYKIASFENTDLPLIRRCAQTGKPMIISTGMASPAELHDAVEAARAAGCRNLILLKTTSTYPASPKSINLRTIPHMAELFDAHVGLSDHTLGIGAAVAAVAMGAVMIEKHFTLARADGGVDAAFSCEPAELTSLVTETRCAFESLGRVRYGAVDQEKKSLAFRRSLYAVEDIQAGAILTSQNVRAIRPGNGLSPKYLEHVLGRTARKDLKRGTPIDWEILS